MLRDGLATPPSATEEAAPGLDRMASDVWVSSHQTVQRKQNVSPRRTQRALTELLRGSKLDNRV